MLHFKEDYPEAVETLLDVNYRCNRNITEGAVNLITNNRKYRELCPSSETVYCIPSVYSQSLLPVHWFSESLPFRNKESFPYGNPGGKNWALDNIDQFEYELKILAGLKPFGAVNFIRKAIGYDEYLREYAQYRHLNVEDFIAT